MDVESQTLDDAQVIAFLTLTKRALESWEASGLSKRSLSRRSPFADEWVALMNEGRRLFGMVPLES